MSSVILKVVLKRDKNIWREIQISKDAKLMSLAEAIVDSVEFDFDHACGFYNTKGNPYDNYESYTTFADSPELESARNEQPISKASVSDVWKEIGDAWTFVFDYGDDWQFLVTLKKKIQDVTKKPTVIKTKGVAPEQYPNYEGDDDEPSDHVDGDSCYCPDCEHELFLEEVGINQYTNLKVDTGIMAVVYLRYKREILAFELLPSGTSGEAKDDLRVSYTPILLPLSGGPSIEVMMRKILKKEHNVSVMSGKGLAPLGFDMGGNQRLVALPYLIEVSGKNVIFDKKSIKKAKWINEQEIIDHKVDVGPLYYPLVSILLAEATDYSRHPVY